ncbi:biotin transporter BioY [Roseobacter sp. HKCCA0434]|uniref:biotin transporter BioY n=1 Tax=Roseobacter sp. HKCCA0434 TaxID=3079297 RepID=UPI002905A54D|nr:biotin transporter BioY [Roseobacter sp. HKCCA0434]
MTRQTPMATTLWSTPSLLRDGALIVGASLLVAIAAQVSVPMFPVPMTLQGLAVLFVGLSLGAWRGAAALSLYLAEGAMGLPVFANGGAGVAYMFGPTFGFLLGFVAMAFVAGFLSERVLGQSLPALIVASLAGMAALYVPGVLWPFAVASAFGVEAGWASSSAAGLWSGWVAPFLIGDAVKVVIAALLVRAGFRAARG